MKILILDLHLIGLIFLFLPSTFASPYSPEPCQCFLENFPEVAHAVAALVESEQVKTECLDSGMVDDFGIRGDDTSNFRETGLEYGWDAT